MLQEKRTCPLSVLCTRISMAPIADAYIIMLSCTAALIVALVAEHFYDIKPCILCHYQRYILRTLIGASVIMILAKRAYPIVKLGRAICIAGLIGGIGLSAYHIGVEQHWWKGPDVCQSNAPVIDPNATMAEKIRAFKVAMDRKSQTLVRCDEVNWRILGISATFWTGFFYAMLLMGLTFLRHRRKESRPLIQ